MGKYCIVIMDGLDRPAMENSRTHPATGPGAGRRTGPPVERSSQGARRHFVDSANRGPVERPAATIWLIPNGPSALPKLGALRCHGKALVDAGLASPGSRRIGSQRMFCGRNLCSGQKRGLLVGKTKRGKGTKIMGIADGHGLPLALRTESASPAEVKLVEATLEERVVADVPERLIGDKAYDSDRLDQQLMEKFGTEMIAPNRANRNPRTQDGRPLRRYKRRWKVERLFAWLFNFRRLVVRYEYHAANFQGFVHLAAAIILLRYL
jgi:transposase